MAGRLHVTHGPLPWPGSVELDAEAVIKLDTTFRPGVPGRGGSYGRAPSIEIYAVTRPSQVHDLVRGLREDAVEGVNFAVLELRKYLDLVPESLLPPR